MLSVIRSRAVRGLESIPVSVEVYTGPGLPKLNIVGLPEKAVRESQHRVKAVLKHSAFKYPEGRIIINLAPADLPKEGGRFDLPIALGILIATRQLPENAVDEFEFLGELGLDGRLRSVRGVLSAALAATQSKHKLIIPHANTAEASLAHRSGIYAADNLLQVCSHITGQDGIVAVAAAKLESTVQDCPDFIDILGQHHALRALEIAAAGGHNCLLMGAPGTGKTMLATRLPGILPSMTHDDAIAVMMIRSLCGIAVEAKHFYQRPFRAPHHSASTAALVGGGSDLRMGEVTRAHNGILFLDELPEFQRNTLETLREPMEKHTVCLSRVAGTIEYPSRFQLIAAMNPCPDGSDVDENGRCPCDDTKLRHYYSRLSAPFLDRIDLHIRVPRIHWSKKLLKPCSDSLSVRRRVIAAYTVQMNRQQTQNAYIHDRDMKRYCCLQKSDKALFYQTIDRLQLSARATQRMIKVARTIADLSGTGPIGREHLLEALSYRSMDKLFRNP